LELKDLTQTLVKTWGYDRFRPPQGEIVDCLLNRRDAIVVMPTGGGKSICFQLPALLQSGLTIVVSPLVALMENQIGELHHKGIAAGVIHSEVPPPQRQATLARLSASQLKLLYLSPETLLSQSIWERLIQPELQIDSLILDEAHCLVQWGDSFRPSYRRLGAVRPALLQSRPPGTQIAIAAFTATADPIAQNTIKTVLQLTNPQAFILDPYRPNLHLKVKSVFTPQGRTRALTQAIDRHPQAAGLVYARTRRDTEELAQYLQGRGDATAAYHAGLAPSSRRRIEQEWLTGKLQYVVCTCAFGMGINKPDVRWIVHFQPPLLLSEYLQEIGRAGRDGQDAIATTIACEPTGWLYPDDRQRHQFFLDRLSASAEQARKLAVKLPFQGHIRDIETKFEQGAIALALLHSMGRLEWLDPFNYRQIDSVKIDRSPQDSQRVIYQQIPRYLRTSECRWRYLLTAFGQSAKPGWKCGKCDRCF
jgi:ATP-dependent DNA helicase RecQ